MGVVCADWLEFARGLDAASVDLVYADPPFATGRVKRSPPGGARMGRAAARYEDSWASVGEWVGWLRERLEATLPAIRRTGSVLLHVDWRTSHHARLLLDDLLGPDRFVNHLVWAYGLGGSSARRFARKHDDILFYCVDPERYWFEAPLAPATSRRMRGRMKKATDVLGDMTKLQSGHAEKGGDEDEGERGAGDVLDVAALNNMARERTGYPTQKPRALLDVLVRACCPPGGLVVDPCCGSGTTLEAAVLAGRRWAGCDANPDAVRIASGRLEACGKGAEGGTTLDPPWCSTGSFVSTRSTRSSTSM
ncbi:MAG: site-specific DNA-methyltransferase [Phycisphaeraceae bacterium]|nr:site-specific DNA-methyltransferase [Phycisphaeraceae bacterium]